MFKDDDEYKLETTRYSQSVPSMPQESFVFFGAILILVGIFLAFVALGLPASLGRGRSQGGAVIIIGPFPIVFGSNRRIARALLILAILLVVSLIVFSLLQSFLVFGS